MSPAGLDIPLSLVPAYQSVVWGGRRLAVWREDLPEGPIGESWDVSDQPRGMSVVENGALAGCPLDQLCAHHGSSVVGQGYDGSGFPLLVKCIDANDRLSVQVHPDDELARSLGVAERGKTECWYLLGEGGELFQGTAPGVDRGAFARAIESQEVAECLNRFTCRDGDFFFMPARTVHALGRGCLLYEIQQSCDCTFRVYDWARLGLDGQARPLHVAESLQTIDFASADHGPRPAALVPDPAGGWVRHLADCAYFRLIERRADQITGRGNAVCWIVSNIGPAGVLQTAAGALPMQSMRSYLIPAAAGDWQATGEAELRLLLTQPVLAG